MNSFMELVVAYRNVIILFNPVVLKHFGLRNPFRGKNSCGTLVPSANYFMLAKGNASAVL